MKYIFHHIPKCGGTSMKKAFGGWFRCRNDYRPPWSTGRRLARFAARTVDLERLREDSMVCGHFEVESIHLHQRYPQVIGHPGFRLITFVREPLSLRLSLLRHEAQHGRISGDEPVRELLLERPNWLARRFPCDAGGVDDVLERYFFIGISEESQAGFDWLARALAKQPVTLPRRNRSRPLDFDITADLEDEFRQVHHLDYRIYESCRIRWRACQG